MSMYLNFEPDYWYKGAAIKRAGRHHKNGGWIVYFEDGMRTYSIIKIYVSTLKQARQKIDELNAKY